MWSAGITAMDDKPSIVQADRQKTGGHRHHQKDALGTDKTISGRVALIGFGKQGCLTGFTGIHCSTHTHTHTHTHNTEGSSCSHHRTRTQLDEAKRRGRDGGCGGEGGGGGVDHVIRIVALLNAPSAFVKGLFRSCPGLSDFHVSVLELCPHQADLMRDFPGPCALLLESARQGICLNLSGNKGRTKVRRCCLM